MSMEKVVAQLNSKNGKQNSINTIFNLYWSIRIIIIYWLDCGSDIKKYNIIFKVNMFILFLLIHFIFIYIYFFLLFVILPILFYHIFYTSMRTWIANWIFLFAAKKRNWLFIQQQQQKNMKIVVTFSIQFETRVYTL